jgi:hypothetical protein
LLGVIPSKSKFDGEGFPTMLGFPLIEYWLCSFESANAGIDGVAPFPFDKGVPCCVSLLKTLMIYCFIINIGSY